MPIASPKNSLLQEIRKAAAGGRPTGEGLIVAEGPHLLGEALRGVWAVEQVLVTEAARLRFSETIDAVQATVTEVSERAFAATATTQAHQGVITLLRPRDWSWREVVGSGELLMALDGIQDPGNAGTLIRSAEAFGASGVVFLPGCVHVSNGKLLRAAAGSVFRVPILENITAAELLRNAREHAMTVFALSASGRGSISDIDLTGPTLLVLGSEGAGISSVFEKAVDTVRIPVGIVESLNVGIAGSIALFEAARQRQGRSQ